MIIWIKSQEKPSEEGLLFWVTRYNYPVGVDVLGQRNCRFSRAKAEAFAHTYFYSSEFRCFFCIYKFCLDYVHRLSCCLLCYLATSKPGHPQRKTLSQKCFGGDGRNRTAVRNAFTLTDIQQYYYLILTCRC